VRHVAPNTAVFHYLRKVTDRFSTSGTEKVQVVDTLRTAHPIQKISQNLDRYCITSTGPCMRVRVRVCGCLSLVLDLHMFMVGALSIPPSATPTFYALRSTRAQMHPETELQLLAILPIVCTLGIVYSFHVHVDYNAQDHWPYTFWGHVTAAACATMFAIFKMVRRAEVAAEACCRMVDPGVDDPQTVVRAAAG